MKRAVRPAWQKLRRRLKPQSMFVEVLLDDADVTTPRPDMGLLE